MALRDLTDRSAVLAAIAEADDLGEAAFLRKYGFEQSRRYRIKYEGRQYASKALLAATHGVQFLMSACCALRNSAAVARRPRRPARSASRSSRPMPW